LEITPQLIDKKKQPLLERSLKMDICNKLLIVLKEVELHLKDHKNKEEVFQN
jgi:hypothetical protein